MDNDAPGWDAIEHAIAGAGIAGQGEVVHYGVDGIPGQGVYGISAYPTRRGWFLVTFDAPAGHVQLLRVVGITAEELARMQAGTTHAVTDEFRAADPTLTTDPAR